MLRNPGVAERAAAAGCIDTVLDAMRAAEAAGPRGFADSATGAQWVQRQVIPQDMLKFCLKGTITA